MLEKTGFLVHQSSSSDQRGLRQRERPPDQHLGHQHRRPRRDRHELQTQVQPSGDKNRNRFFIISKGPIIYFSMKCVNVAF